MSGTQSSGEIQVLILDKLKEQGEDIKTLAGTINGMALVLNDGKHTMGSHGQRIEQQARDHLDLSRTVDGLDSRVGAVEAAIAAAKAAAEAKAEAARRDDASDWRSPSKHKALVREEPKTESHRRPDAALWIKIGLLIGAVVAGYVGAKAAPEKPATPPAPQAQSVP